MTAGPGAPVRVEETTYFGTVSRVRTQPTSAGEASTSPASYPRPVALHHLVDDASSQYALGFLQQAGVPDVRLLVGDALAVVEGDVDPVREFVQE